MLNWLREKVTSRDTSANPGSSGGGLGSPTGEASSSSYDSLSKDDADSFGSSGRSTLVVVRDAAVPKMTLDSNDLQLLRDIPEFKPLLHEGSGVSGAASIDTKALIQICKIYQSHMHTSAENISVEQNHLTARMKEIDATIKVLMERLQERQKAYARSADQLKKTPDITLSLKKMRYNIRETEEMLRQLNAQLPDDLKLEPFYFVDKPDSKTATEGCTGNKLT